MEYDMNKKMLYIITLIMAMHSLNGKNFVDEYDIYNNFLTDSDIITLEEVKSIFNYFKHSSLFVKNVDADGKYKYCFISNYKSQ